MALAILAPIVWEIAAPAQSPVPTARGAVGHETRPPARVSEEFRIGPEDVLDISVWGDEQVSRTVPVRPDGRISLPLLNDVQAAGLTPAELTHVLTERLSRHLTDPRVSVIVQEIHSFKVSVIGEVKTPGRYELKSEATVLDVLARAGGFTEFASRSRILILRHRGKTVERIRFDYQRFVSTDEHPQEVYVQPGDIVVVR